MIDISARARSVDIQLLILQSYCSTQQAFDSCHMLLRCQCFTCVKGMDAHTNPPQGTGVAFTANGATLGGCSRTVHAGLLPNMSLSWRAARERATRPWASEDLHQTIVCAAQRGALCRGERSRGWEGHRGCASATEALGAAVRSRGRVRTSRDGLAPLLGEGEASRHASSSSLAHSSARRQRGSQEGSGV